MKDDKTFKIDEHTAVSTIIFKVKVRLEVIVTKMPPLKAKFLKAVTHIFLSL